MLTTPLIQTVTLSRQAVDSPEPYDAVQCNIDFVNLLIGEYFKAGELPADSLLSYYVDYYLSQVNNGGFAQFIYNSGLDDEINDWIAQGLQKMGAVRHVALFAQSLKRVREMPEDKLQTFFNSEFFGQNHERDALNESNEAFYALEDEEDLDEINGRWLRSLPNLKIVDEADFAKSDAAVEIVKIINVGYAKGGVVLRAEKDEEGDAYYPSAKDVVGPKILATRKLFEDRATESRCLTKRMTTARPRP